MQVNRIVKALIGAFLVGALAACSSSPAPYTPSPSDEERIAIEATIGGPEYGSVVQIVRSGGSHPLNSYSSCDGYNITLTEKATPEMLADLLMELVTQRSCFGDGSTVTFAGRDTVVRTWLSGMRETPDNLANVAEMVYSNWPPSVVIDEDEAGYVDLYSTVAFAPAPMSSLHAALQEMPDYEIPETSDGQLPITISIVAAIGDDAELLTPRTRVFFDPDLRPVAERVVAEITALDAATQRPDSPIGVDLFVSDGVVRGKVMLAVPSEEHAIDEPALWGSFNGRLGGTPAVRDDTPKWKALWAIPNERAYAVTAEVHELIAATGLRDEVEVLLVQPGRFGYVDAGYFDEFAGRDEAGLASSHPDATRE